MNIICYGISDILKEGKKTIYLKYSVVKTRALRFIEFKRCINIKYESYCEAKEIKILPKHLVFSHESNPFKCDLKYIKEKYHSIEPIKFEGYILDYKSTRVGYFGTELDLDTSIQSFVGYIDKYLLDSCITYIPV